MNESAMSILKSSISVLYSPVSSGYKLCLSFWCRTQGLGCLLWCTNSSFLRGSSVLVTMGCWLLTPDCGLLSWVGSLVRWHLCLSSPCWCGLFILCCGGSVHLFSGCFSEGLFACVAVDLLCPWEKVSSGTSHLVSWTASTLSVSDWYILRLF